MNRYSSNLADCIGQKPCSGQKHRYLATGTPAGCARDYIRAALGYCFCRVKVNVVTASVHPSEEQVAV